MAMKLGDLLVQTRVISQEQLEAALDRQAAYGGKLGEILVHYGFVAEEVLVRALSKLTGVPRADLSGEPDPLALARVSREVAEQCGLVPFAMGEDGRSLRVAMSDPQNGGDLERVRAVAGCEVVPHLATATDIRSAQERWYSPQADVVTAPIVLARAGPAEAPPGEAAAQDVDAGGRAASAAPEEAFARAPPATEEAFAPAPPAAEVAFGRAPPALWSLRSGKLALGALALLAALLVAALLYAASLRARLDTAGRGIEAHLKTIALQAQQVDALDLLATRVDQFNREFGGTVGRLQVEDLELGVGRLLKRGDVPAQAKQILAEFERNAEEIRSMGAQLRQLQAYLGAPAQVKRGDTHAQMALDYLKGQAGLTDERAEAVVRQTALAWDLEPGNQVYSLYWNGVLLSTVTQGTAARLPLLAQSAQRRALQARAQGLEAKLRECEARGRSTP